MLRASPSDLTELGMLLICDTHTHAPGLFALPIKLHVRIWCLMILQ